MNMATGGKIAASNMLFWTVLHRYKLGSLSAKQIKIITSGGSFWLDQRELASGGIKLLVIILGFDEYGIQYSSILNTIEDWESLILSFILKIAMKRWTLKTWFYSENMILNRVIPPSFIYLMTGMIV